MGWLLPCSEGKVNSFQGTWVSSVGGVLLPCQVFGPGMCARGRGSSINIASVSAHLSLSRVVSYSSAKAAVLNLNQFQARELAGAAITNTSSPASAARKS